MNIYFGIFLLYKQVFYYGGSKVRKSKRVMSLLLMLVLAIGLAFTTGCSKKTDSAKTVVVTVGDKDIYLNEMMYYIYAIEATGASYDQYYQQYYGSSYWDMEYSEGVTMREQTKEYVMDTVIMYEILYDKAIKAGYTITEEEKTQAETNADTIMSQISEEQLKITGFTKEVLTDVQEKLIIGEKYYSEMVNGFSINDQEISDSINFEDYRQYNTEYIFAATTDFNENSEIVDLTDEEKATAYESISNALEKVKAGEEFTAITEADTTLLSSTLNFIYGDTNAEATYQDAAIELENNAFTNNIIETEYGYYIIKMVDNNSTEGYDAAVESAITTAEEEAFDAEYEAIKQEYTITINSKVWDPIVMGRTTLISTATETAE
jgi:foldase protein PrsA